MAKDEEIEDEEESEDDESEENSENGENGDISGWLNPPACLCCLL